MILMISIFTLLWADIIHKVLIYFNVFPEKFNNLKNGFLLIIYYICCVILVQHCKS